MKICGCPILECNLKHETFTTLSDTQGELFEILEDDKCLPEEQVQAIAKQLVLTNLRILVPSHLNTIQQLIFLISHDLFLPCVHYKSKLSFYLFIYLYFVPVEFYRLERCITCIPTALSIVI